jgi:hypothetical protein
MAVKVTATCDYCSASETGPIDALKLPPHWFRIEETRDGGEYIGIRKNTRHFCGLGCVRAFYTAWDQREADREAREG